MSPTVNPPTEWSAYKHATRTATYGFLAALPLVLIYELLVVFANQGAVAQVRVGAEVWLKQLLALVGNTGVAALGIVVLVVGAAVFWIERKKHIPIRARYFWWMVLESALYAVLTATIVSGLVGAVLSAAPLEAVLGTPPLEALRTILPQEALLMIASDGVVPITASPEALLMLAPQEEGGLLLQLALSIGAGVYEELLFRVLLVGGLYLALRRVLTGGAGTGSGRTAAYVAAALIGAFLFSLVHYLGPLGDAFAMGSFLFRFLFGLVMNVLFLLRGFGIAAWTHALYDVMVVLVMSG